MPQGSPYNYGPPPPAPGHAAPTYPGDSAMYPPTMRRIAQTPGIYYEQVPCALPYPWLPQNDDPNRPMPRIPREYVMQFSWGTDITAVGTAAIKSIRWDVIGSVYALVGGIYNSTGAALSTAAGANPMNLFTVGIQQANGYQYVTATGGSQVLGGTIFSPDAGRPTYIPAGAWPINNGTILQVTLVPLVPDITVHLNFRTMESPGPSNLNFSPAGA